MKWLGWEPTLLFAIAQSALTHKHTHTQEGLINSFFSLFCFVAIFGSFLNRPSYPRNFCVRELFTGVCFRFLICGPLSQFSLLFSHFIPFGLDSYDFCIHSVWCFNLRFWLLAIMCIQTIFVCTESHSPARCRLFTFNADDEELRVYQWWH